jgi:hypothetical protein
MLFLKFKNYIEIKIGKYIYVEFITMLVNTTDNVKYFKMNFFFIGELKKNKKILIVKRRTKTVLMNNLV